MTFTADQVWGLAARADTQNDGYVKEDVWNRNSEANFIAKKANKALVKQWLHEGEVPTDSEVEQGREYRRFFNTYTLKALMGGLSSFDRQALRIAQMEQFGSRDLMEIALVSCLPSVCRREQTRTELKREVFSSTQLSGQPGDRVQGRARIVSCDWSQNYGRYRVVAQIDDSFADFWFADKIEGTVNIRAKIKQQRGDNTTQLNYVRVDKQAV